MDDSIAVYTATGTIMIWTILWGDDDDHVIVVSQLSSADASYADERFAASLHDIGRPIRLGLVSQFGVLQCK